MRLYGGPYYRQYCMGHTKNYQHSGPVCVSLFQKVGDPFCERLNRRSCLFRVYISSSGNSMLWFGERQYGLAGMT